VSSPSRTWKNWRARVVVAYLAGAGRNELFDDAELGRFNEVPAVAVGALRASPFVVFGGFCVGDLGGHARQLSMM
jgi:hypothetical protein